MHKIAVIALACLALLTTTSAQQSCDGLMCDNCPTYRDQSGNTIQVEQTKNCVVTNGKAELQCACADPPTGALPAARDATATAGTNNSQAGAGGGADFNDLPPDGGTGSVIPTQSFGAPPSAAVKPSVRTIF